MTLASSGSISIGGSTSGRSINLELGRSATASSNLNESSLRSLANRSSGSISLSQFHGKSAAEIQTVTVGSHTASGYITVTQYGYGSVGATFGSISDGTLGPVGNKTIQILAWNSFTNVILRVAGSASNSGFTTMKVHNTNFSRSAATYTNQGTYTQWSWFGTSTNPFGTSGTKQVTFT